MGLVWMVFLIVFVPILLFVVLPLILISGLRSNKSPTRLATDADWAQLMQLESARQVMANRVRTLQVIIAKDFPDARIDIQSDDVSPIEYERHSDSINQQDKLTNSISKLDNQILQLETILDAHLPNWRKR